MYTFIIYKKPARKSCRKIYIKPFRKVKGINIYYANLEKIVHKISKKTLKNQLTKYIKNDIIKKYYFKERMLTVEDKATNKVIEFYCKVSRLVMEDELVNIDDFKTIEPELKALSIEGVFQFDVQDNWRKQWAQICKFVATKVCC